VLPWHFKKEFLERERETLLNGTSFIFPLPKLDIITIDSL
jgi:NDP-4-keto-2,6-dideoxyhexose 3-C-methyltransferase